MELADFFADDGKTASDLPVEISFVYRHCVDKGLQLGAASLKRDFVEIVPEIDESAIKHLLLNALVDEITLIFGKHDPGFPVKEIPQPWEIFERNIRHGCE